MQERKLLTDCKQSHSAVGWEWHSAHSERQETNFCSEMGQEKNSNVANKF